MMKKMGLILLLYAFSPSAFAQNTCTIKGVITDARSMKPLIGVNIHLKNGEGTVTDIWGKYELKAEPGPLQLHFSFVGYESRDVPVTAIAGKTIIKNLAMVDRSEELGMVVVSAGRFEQKPEDLTVSMEVLSASLVENKNTTSLETALDQVPGCTVQDGQISIRGGSGFAYGAGSRVLMMVDGMPLLSGDAGDIKWNTLPVENLEQIEVVKGASSVLYGSSALNGVVNVRTRYPTDEPVTRLTLYHGVYGDPVRVDSHTGTKQDTNGLAYKPAKWWDQTPYHAGFHFLHAHKMGNLDLVVGSALFTDEGYREGETERRARVNVNTRYHSKKTEGLSYGLNFNSQRATGGLYFLWLDADSGALRPAGGLDPATTTISEYIALRHNIDPHLTYWATNGDKHTLQARWYRTDNKNNTNQEALADQFYGEYQFQRSYEGELTLTSGLAGFYTRVRSDLYGVHKGNNLALFSQLDKKWEKLSISVGLRAEYYSIDTFTSVSNFKLGNSTLPIQPVFRTGINYKLAKATNVRASFGQGYRYPTIAEKFISTSVGPLQIFANPGLQPETGWSSEIGMKQGLRAGSWKGYVDAAFFWQEYTDMMEFTFGVYLPDSVAERLEVTDPNYISTAVSYAGFRAENVEKSRITGLDLSFVGSGNPIGALDIAVFMGYTYINPVSFNTDPTYRASFSDTSSNMLKYRYKHLIKGDVQLGYKKWSAGFGVRYNSFMENIDVVFQDLQIPINTGFLPLGDVLLPGIETYRERNNKGDLVFDGRLAYEVSENVRLSFLLNNVLNREYTSRPGDIQPPRTFIGQLLVNL